MDSITIEGPMVRHLLSKVGPSGATILPLSWLSRLILTSGETVVPCGQPLSSDVICP